MSGTNSMPLEEMIDFPVNPPFYWNLASQHRENINQGGTWSSKTRSIMQVMLMRCAMNPKWRSTVTGDSFPHLRDGPIDDFTEIWESSEFFQDRILKYNENKKKVFFKNGSVLTFKTYKNVHAAKSGKRDDLFVNEADKMTFEVYRTLAARTRHKIYIDYNPDVEFWVHKKVVPKPTSQLFISNCFDHNQFCPDSIKRELLEQGENDPNYMRVYGYGLTGRVQGLVFPRVGSCRSFPENAKRVAYSIDWGFSSSPTVVMKWGIYNKMIYGEQVVFDTNLSTQQVAQQMKDYGVPRNAIIICDNNDPKSTSDLRAYGYKTAKSVGDKAVKYSIKRVNSFPKILLTDVSVDAADNFARYKRKVNPDGSFSDEPIKKHDHAPDTLRYYALEVLPAKNLSKKKYRSASA